MATPDIPRLSRVQFYLCTGGDLVAALANAIDATNRYVSPTQDALVAWSRLQYDVPNGGFVQFFYNHRGDRGLATLAALLEEFDLPKPAKCIREATAIYHEHRAAFQVANPWDGLFGSIKAFDKLDRAFERSVDRGNKAFEAWVRGHIADLATDEDGKPLDTSLTGVVETRGRDGVVLETLEVKKGRPHGAYREFFEDGSPRNVQFYKAGKLTGDFWPSGQPKRKESKRGPLTVIEWFYPSGKLQKRYVKNKEGYPAEPVRMYHENGQLAEELTVIEGRDPRGPWRKFFEDGAPKLEAEYAAGRRLVVHNAWDENRVQVVKDGTGTFREDSHSINWEYDLVLELGWTNVTEFKDGTRHGKVTRYSHGVLWGVTHFENGVEQGASTLYWNNGRVRTVTKYVDGKAGKEKSFPKFDQPVPAVVLTVTADETLYTAWGHVPVDEYPEPLNLEQVKAKLVPPIFLREVYERNLAKELKSDYENWNTFHDGIAYFLTVNAAGEVTDAAANGSGAYSGGSWGAYPLLLKELRFTPGRIRGRAIECRVLARVDHTFVEGAAAECFMGMQT